jgi:hypothetical protein
MIYHPMYAPNCIFEVYCGAVFILWCRFRPLDKELDLGRLNSVNTAR